MILCQIIDMHGMK